MEIRGGKELRIEVRGRRPPSLKNPEQGDAAFVESYRRALAAHDRLREEELSKRSIEELAQRLIEAKTGSRLDFVKVEAIPAAWAAIPRKRPPSPVYVKRATATLRRFAEWMRDHYPEADDLAKVRADHVRGFLAAEDRRGLAPRTWNVSLKLLKTIFAKLEPGADAFRTFLKSAAFRHEDTVHREPFTDEEVDAVLLEARRDRVLYGPIVAALCTAMRRGDCAMLKKASVDLKAGFVQVRTSKTGELAEIPILPMLRDVLAEAMAGAGDYVFPLAAEMYQKNQNAVDGRWREILTRVGFVDAETPGQQKKEKRAAEAPALPILPLDEVRRRGLAVIASGRAIEAKRARMRESFTRYLDGADMPAVARAMGVSKSTVCLHLNEIEEKIGAAVVRRPAIPEAPIQVRGALHAASDGGQRLRRGSIRGWHSFRVTFITRALAGGMPEEMVRRVTGHKAVEVVREHYFRPGRAEFRREFEKAMPRMTMNGGKSRDERLREIIETATVKTWPDDRARLLAILDGGN